MIQHQQYGCNTFESVATIVLAVGRILSFCETLEVLHGLENITKASVDAVMKSKWV